VLVITHDPELVDACADTIIALHPLNATDANTNKAKRSAPQDRHNRVESITLG
jgi:ATPase subunit of ABC transporter with duplicated ATPase domains